MGVPHGLNVFVQNVADAPTGQLSALPVLEHWPFELLGALQAVLAQMIAEKLDRWTISGTARILRPLPDRRTCAGRSSRTSPAVMSINSCTARRCRRAR